MERDLISVVMPTHKRKPELIEKSIKSVLNQTYSNLELIIVDDSPREYTERIIVKEFVESLKDKRIIYIEHDRNMGANIARNTGVDNSTGKYIAFIDDDDEWFPTKIEKQYEVALKYPEVALVYCKAILINEHNGKVRPIINWMYRGNQYKRLLRQNFIGSNSFVLVKRKVFYEVGKYDESLLSNQDYDLFIRISKEHDIDFVEEVLVRYYIHKGERISTNPEKQLQGRLALYDKYLTELKKDKDLYVIWKIKNIPLYFRAGQKKKAIKLFTDVFFSRPIYMMNYLRSTLEYIKLKRN